MIIKVRRRMCRLVYGASFVSVVALLKFPAIHSVSMSNGAFVFQTVTWLCLSYSNESKITLKIFQLTEVCFLVNMESLWKQCLRDCFTIFCAFVNFIWTPGCSVLLSCWRRYDKLWMISALSLENTYFSNFAYLNCWYFIVVLWTRYINAVQNLRHLYWSSLQTLKHCGDSICGTRSAEFRWSQQRL